MRHILQRQRAPHTAGLDHGRREEVETEQQEARDDQKLKPGKDTRQHGQFRVTDDKGDGGGQEEIAGEAEGEGKEGIAPGDLALLSIPRMRRLMKGLHPTPTAGTQ
jgi:hypothetical protein